MGEGLSFARKTSIKQIRQRKHGQESFLIVFRGRRKADYVMIERPTRRMLVAIGGAD
jgi:hypothetical protein